MRKLSKMSFLLILLTSLFSLSTAVDILTPDGPLLDGETMISAGGIFALGFFTPSNSSKNRYVGIWYNKISTQTVVWIANRNNPIAGSNASLSITSNGTLVVTDNNSTVMWSSSSTATTVSNPIAQILDTGNFIVKEADNGNSQFYAWQSFDYPTDTLLPGMKLGWNLTIGLNRNLTSWASLTDPSTGSYNLFMDISGDPQLFLGSSTTRTWRSGPWNGERFIGIPEMKTHGISTLNFVQNSEEVYIQFYFKDPTVITLLNVNKDGSFQRLVWLDQPKTWKLFWSAPRDQCDKVSTCGPFGVCNPNDSPICACVQGFVPQNQGNWDLWDWTDGCVRKTPLDCRNGTDKFMTITEVKLPDTSSSTMDMSPNRDQCMAKCLANCSCTAYARSDIYGTGSGCLIWTSNLTDLRVMSFGGQDLYVRLAAVDLGNAAGGSHGRHGAMVVIVLSFVGGVLLLTCVFCFLWRRKKRRGANISINKEALDLPLFDFSTIATATNNFSDVNKLGQGGFGPVYKGNLGEDQEIAIKRLAKTSLQGIEEFKNEVVLIAKLQHRNLVRLLGCCIHGEERMLIYEYMPNGSLDSFLFDKEKCALLDWKTRYQIIIGITRGLLYLHHDSRLRIIHRDLKPSNILLDNGMNPKISDFGMARIFGGDEMTDFNTRKVVGTYGYMSPEYAMEGIFSMKSDVFSFGVLLLEIVSGRKNRGEYTFSPHLNLVAHAWSLWNEGKSLQLVHESMGDSFPTEEALKCIKVGLLCVQERSEERPLMSSVVIMLGNENDIASLPTPKQPGFIAFTALDSGQSSSTVNDLTVSLYGSCIKNCFHTPFLAMKETTAMLRDNLRRSNNNITRLVYLCKQYGYRPKSLRSRKSIQLKYESV